MHLHARRIRIDHPDGGKLDVKAELPDHFAESMKTLGFDLSLGEQLPMEEAPPPSREQKKAEAKAHAKTYRKERRGERRSRGDRAAPKAAPKAPPKKR
jgi:23S rRNA pseudouridine955/2504/2580 synthase